MKHDVAVWIDVCIAFFLEWTKSVVSQAQRVQQIGSKDVNLADGEVGGMGGGNSEPRIQLRAATRTSASTRELVFSFAIQIAARERVLGRKLVIHFYHEAVGRLPAAIVDHERTCKVQRRIKSRNVHPQFVHGSSVGRQQVLCGLNVLRRRGVTA